jgi:hypothetical protein
MKQKASLLLVYGMFLCCSVLALFSGVASAAGPPDQVGGLKMVTTTPVPSPTYITCPAEYQCLLPNEADTNWGTGKYTIINTGACGAVPIYDSGKVLKYCYKPLESNPPAVIPLQAQPPQPVQVIPVKADTCIVAGKTKCGGNCVDMQTDRANCGACGNQCPLGSGCKAGACSAPKIVAATDKCKIVGKTNCNGNCVDITSDVFNCGACDNICDYGFKCINGICGLGCAAGLDECRYDCVDLKTDNNNCGGCGVSCPLNQTCYQEKCLGDSGGVSVADAQLANINLQNSLQKEQQSFQIMTNIAKLLDDIGSAIMRNIGG